jgi:predicted nucleic acid-binding protein
MPLGTLVGSNVLLDVFTEDRRWGRWSAEQLVRAFDAGSVAINRGGTRRAPLPDFCIAAHAAVIGRVLLTRDRPRHLDLLPTLEVISPD